MSELRDRLQADREARIAAHNERAEKGDYRSNAQTVNDQIRDHGMDGFVREIAASRNSRGNQADNRAIETRQTQLGPDGKRPAGPQANPRNDKGVPVDFFCWKEGRIAIITVYAVSEATFL